MPPKKRKQASTKQDKGSKKQKQDRQKAGAKHVNSPIEREELEGRQDSSDNLRDLSWDGPRTSWSCWDWPDIPPYLPTLEERPRSPELMLNFREAALVLDGLPEMEIFEWTMEGHDPSIDLHLLSRTWGIPFDGLLCRRSDTIMLLTDYDSTIASPTFMNQQELFATYESSNSRLSGGTPLLSLAAT